MQQHAMHQSAIQVRVMHMLVPVDWGEADNHGDALQRSVAMWHWRTGTLPCGVHAREQPARSQGRCSSMVGCICLQHCNTDGASLMHVMLVLQHVVVPCIGMA